MNEKIIKWCCEYAPGFEIVCDQDKDIYIKETITDIHMFCALDLFEDFSMYPVLWPHFLQVVLEGIETRYSELGYTFHRQYKCSTCEWTMEVRFRGTIVYVSERYIDIIDAKEAVIEWVYNNLSEREYC